jgi:chemotaxis response regulator CheB
LYELSAIASFPYSLNMKTVSTIRILQHSRTTSNVSFVEMMASVRQLSVRTVERVLNQ